MVATHLSDLATSLPDLATHLPNLATHLPNFLKQDLKASINVTAA
jgi:hypothetical protein